MTETQWIGVITLGPVMVFVVLFVVGSLANSLRDWLCKRRER